MLNEISLPSWLSTGMVFQQNVPLILYGYTKPLMEVKLEVVKDPTDGRKVSKLDTDYGIILTKETRSDKVGRFGFELPAYKSSTDAYTFIFSTLNLLTITIKDIRCGDIWIMFGSDPISIPISKTAAPRTPLKPQPLQLIRWFQNKRTRQEDWETYSYDPLHHIIHGQWINARQREALSQLSSVAFSLAYHLADQLRYPVGIIDLAVADASILSFISRDTLENIPEAISYLKKKNQYYNRDDFSQWEAQRYLLNLQTTASKEEALADITFDKEHKDIEDKEDLLFDCVQSEAIEVKTEEKKEISKSSMSLLQESALFKELILSEVDPHHLHNTEEIKFSPKALGDNDKEKQNETKAKEFSSLSLMQDKSLIESIEENAEVNVLQTEEEEERAFDMKTAPSKMMSLYFNHLLSPLKELSIRGIVFAPDILDWELTDYYEELIKGLLLDLSKIFGPRKIKNRQHVPSMLLMQLKPAYLGMDHPYNIANFNENLLFIKQKLPMPISILGQHDRLLVDRAETFQVGNRLACMALGIHFTPKMPSSSPECVGIEVVGNKVMLSFDNTNDGLRLGENESILRGFTICGPDRIYYPAQAKILHGVRVMVWHEAITQPIGVTYGYLPIPSDATFRNRTGLPVLPFRSDRKKASYAPDLTFAHCDQLSFIGLRNQNSEFDYLPIYEIYLGSGKIELEFINKTQGSASLRIGYQSIDNKFSFGPNLAYTSLYTPWDWKGFKGVKIDVFNPDQQQKALMVSGSKAEIEIERKLNWQTLIFQYDECKTDFLKFFEITVIDKLQQGTIYIDNIRFY